MGGILDMNLHETSARFTNHIQSCRAGPADNQRRASRDSTVSWCAALLLFVVPRSCRLWRTLGM